MFVEGSKQIYQEIKTLKTIISAKKYEQRTAYELRETQRIKLELVKFVPFIFFIIIPFAELLLPPYLMLFPNALPSSYALDHQHDHFMHTFFKNQQSSSEVTFPP